MAEVNYEHVGRIIFGVGRLDFMAEALTRWMAGQTAQTEELPGLDKLTRQAEIAGNYFSMHNTAPTVREQFGVLIDTLRLLEHDQQQLTRRAEAGELDYYLDAIGQAHQLLADIVEGTGCPGLFPDALRSRGAPSINGAHP